MKKILLLILFINIMHNSIIAQLKIGAEIYSYIKMKPAIQPIGYLQTADNWHVELRYNYEDEKTLSVYGGKIFSGGRNLEYNITPMLGFSGGRFTGVSFATNTDVTFKNFFLSSQSQYSLDVKKKDSTVVKKNSKNFFFSWSELGYNISDNFYAGVAMQFTLQTGLNEFRPGIMAGLCFNKIQLPFYVFSPFQKGRYFIIGIIYDYYQMKKK